MPRSALITTSLLLALGATSCGTDAASPQDASTSASPSTATPAVARTDYGSYDHEVDISRIRVTPEVTKAFSEVDVTNAKHLVERWVGDLTLRSEDALKSGSSGYASEDFAHLRPYVTDEFWKALTDSLPGARRSARVTADVAGAKSTDRDGEDFSRVLGVGGYGINTPGYLDKKSGVIEPKARDIRILGTEYPNAVEVAFTVDYYVAFTKDGLALVKKEEEKIPEGFDGAHVSFDRTIRLERDTPGEPWKTYYWSSEAGVAENVSIADALGS